MDKKETQKLWKALGLGFMTGVFLLGATWFLFSNHSQQRLTKKEESLTELHSQLSQAKTQNKNMKAQLTAQPTERLTETTQQLFSLYYNYNQAKTLNRERQKLSKNMASQAVREQLFPLSSDQQKSDYGSIKSQLQNCRVYLCSQKGSIMEALVLCDFSSQAGAIHSDQSNEAWAIQFDFHSKQVVSATDLGHLKAF